VPVRRLNYTARQRISQADVDILLHGTSGGCGTFDAAPDLSQYGFPSDARVFIEAYRQTTLMRFDFGTVSVMKPPTDRMLTDFADLEEVLFRVKVTAVSGLSGVLLGIADRIRPRSPDETPDQRLPLLPPLPEDLDQEAWRVDFEGGTYLLVSRHLPDWKQTVKSNTFRALVYPAAMRQILERILFIENFVSTDDPGDWRGRWLIFAAALPGSGAVPTGRDAQSDWIESAVAAFARKFNLRTKYCADAGE
jgi:hypothetical protein